MCFVENRFHGWSRENNFVGWMIPLKQFSLMDDEFRNRVSSMNDGFRKRFCSENPC
jgi:hypothetical protein